MIDLELRNSWLRDLAGMVGFIGLHAVMPGATGQGEITGGNPKYLRRPVEWQPVTRGRLATTVPLLFDVPPGADVAYFGLWTAVEGGRCLGGDRVNGVLFRDQGVYTLASLDITIGGIPNDIDIPRAA